jgi:hypothetical protein
VSLLLDSLRPQPKKALRSIAAAKRKSNAGLVFLTTTCLRYLIVCNPTIFNPTIRSLTFRPYNSAEVPPANMDPASRCRKNPSSYPDLSTRPFCITTLIRPLKFKVLNKCSIAAESTSEALTFRRNSTKSFPSFELSSPLMAARLPKTK